MESIQQTSITSSESADSGSHLVTNIKANILTNIPNPHTINIDKSHEPSNPIIRIVNDNGIRNDGYIGQSNSELNCSEIEQRRSDYAAAYAEMLSEEKIKSNNKCIKPQHSIQTKLTKDERWISTLEPSQSSVLQQKFQQISGISKT